STIKTLLGDYPVTRALKSGEVRSHDIALEFADIKPVSSGFKRVVRELEFDVSELALATFLIAKAHGKPLTLLPAVVMARFQHPFLVYDAERGALSPGDLHGRRVGVRSYSVTTGAWLRSILADDHGVDLDRVTWVTFEDPHVAEFHDPPNVERAPAGKQITPMLMAGELDAAILGEIPKDPRLRPLIPDPERAAEAWRKKHGAIQLNHMVVTRRGLPQAEAVYALLAESRKAAGNPELNPFGVEENRHNLEVAVDCFFRQKLIPRRFTVDELFQ
ncbi:MAG TPA: ABC transporter substrate-binding protein, partial [Myxococcaceae bacterium]|nr:ABC transporter substrate-binding protein [Myxococcaceae bacterium]